MTLSFTILGCGSSPGVPRVNGDWGACDPNEPRNRRLRCSLLIERTSENGTTRVVVDTGPDFRQQMLSAKVPSLDGVLYTHSHADHLHGINDLRGFALAQRQRINVYADAPTKALMFEAFRYCFEQAPDSMYPAILECNELADFQPVEIKGKGGSIHALPVVLIHGPIKSLGFRFSEDGSFDSGGLCYCPDVSDIPDETIPHLNALDYWIVDGLQPTPHVSHLSIPEAIERIDRVQPKKAILTHMNIPVDYNETSKELPQHIVLAYDQMVIGN